MPQTSMSADPAIALNGELAYPHRPSVTESSIADQAGGIPFGCFVTMKTANTVDLPTTLAEVTTTGVGFAFRDQTKPFDGTGFAVGEDCSILRKGYVYTLTEGPVTKEGAVFARYTASGGNTQLGKVRADADTTTAGAVPNARFVTTLAAAGLAIVEVF